MKKLKLLSKTLLVAATLCIGATSAWADATWSFKDNTSVWGSVSLNNGNQFDATATAVATGGLTFTGTEGFVSTALGIGFKATGSTSNENISLVVPAGYKAAVTIYTSSNRTVVAHFGTEADQTYNANWASTKKEFNNAEGTEDVTLYLYCNQNPGGENQKQAPFLQEIILTDMSTVSSFPWSANAVATIGGVKTTIKTYSSTADVDEGSDYTVIVDKVIEYNGDFYALNDAAFAANVYGKTYTMGSEAGAHEFTYEKLENAVFYGEVENIYTAGKNANKAVDISELSNGGGYSAMSSSGGYVTVTFNVPTAGVYDLVLGMNNTNSSNRGFNYAIDEAEVSSTITVTKNSAYVQNIENQFLTAGDHTLTMNITYSLTPVFDYLIVIAKSSDTTVPATVTDAGYATFVAPYALDFSSTAIEAYKVKVSTKGVATLTKVEKVPAGTPVLLVKDGGATEDIPMTSEAAAVTANDLVAGTDAAVATTDGDYTNMILNNIDGNVGFYFANGQDVAANKAYLHINSTLAPEAAASRLVFVFDGETTAISTVKQAAGEGAVYNLSGQRVGQPTKGLYIVNGKKVVMK